ncbi:MAG: amino acid ABC transporter permease [Anaerolineales bacterium]|nr:amino acid ABC transporter permease [Anaerolineae bacterium]PWB69147.1 MAG: amino acid ABC transporter permease [Anaerolineales bacterium]
MTNVNSALPPLTERSNILRWLRKNLFGSWTDTILTFIGLLITYWALKGFLTWAFTVAEWEVISVNLRLIMIGQYPIGQTGRLWLWLAFLVFLSGNSIGIWARKSKYAVLLLLSPALLALLPFDASIRQWLIALTVTGLIGWGLGRARPEVLKRSVIIGWAISLPIIILLTHGFSESETGFWAIAKTNLWGGLLLTFLLTVVGILFSFPLGVLLALGRRSELPIVRWFSVAYIELVRGVPLITILFMAQLMLPLFLPEGLTIDRVLRAMVGITLFSAAYLAENVRGGLQAIPKGQYEAAHALGLSGAQTMIFIILPQALRLIIPILVGQFIAVFKDTSLVAIVGLFDLVGIARTVLAQPEFLGLQREVYAFISLLYWVLSYGMSYLSQRLEESLGVGKR